MVLPLQPLGAQRNSPGRLLNCGDEWVAVCLSVPPGVSFVDCEVSGGAQSSCPQATPLVAR